MSLTALLFITDLLVRLLEAVQTYGKFGTKILKVFYPQREQAAAQRDQLMSCIETYPVG